MLTLNFEARALAKPMHSPIFDSHMYAPPPAGCAFRMTHLSHLLQGVLLAILVYSGVISNEDWTMDDQHNVAAGIQDFLICIEMFFAAIAHAYAFPPRVGAHALNTRARVLGFELSVGCFAYTRVSGVLSVLVLPPQA